MDILERFDDAAHEFWRAWAGLDNADKERLKSTHLYHQVFLTAFNIKQALQKQLMSGPAHHRVYSRHQVPEHVIDCAVSDSDDSP